MDLSLIPNIKHTNSNNFFLLAGPCAIESEEMAMRIAEKVITITDKLEIPYVFKGSFKKANRSRIVQTKVHEGFQQPFGLHLLDG